MVAEAESRDDWPSAACVPAPQRTGHDRQDVRSGRRDLRPARAGRTTPARSSTGSDTQLI